MGHGVLLVPGTPETNHMQTTLVLPQRDRDGQNNSEQQQGRQGGVCVGWEEPLPLSLNIVDV